MTRTLVWAPLAAFVAFVGVAATGLMRPDDHLVHSAMVGRPLPSFSLPPIAPGKPGLSTATFQTGGPRLLNVFASWCVPCIAEAPQIQQLKAMGVTVEGIAIRDRPAALASFLRRTGDPYAHIGDDRVSAVQLSLGSSGVPETFVVDGKGVIRLQHIGPLTPEDLPAIVDAVRAAR